MQYEITDSMIEERKRFIVQALKDRFPEGDWSRKSTLYDHALGAIVLNSLINKLTQQEVVQLFDIDSILSITDEDTKRAAMERYAKTLNLSLSPGSFAIGYVDVIFSTQTEGLIPPGTRFYGTGFVLQVTNTEPLFFTFADMLPVVSTTNLVTGYKLRVAARSLTPGLAGNVKQQKLSAYDRFSLNITGAEISAPFTGGAEPQSAEEFAERVPDALTLRQPTTYRALRTLLRDNFAAILSQPVVIGYGEPEMTRDRAPFTLQDTRIHRGGSVDVYCDIAAGRTPLTAVVGSEQQDTTELLLNFRDLDLDFRDIDLRGLVSKNNVIRINNPENGESALYKVHSVNAYYLTVTSLTPFKAPRPTRIHDGTVYENIVVDSSLSKITIPDEETRFTTQNVGDYVYVTDGQYSLFAVIRAANDLNVSAFARELLVDDPSNTLSLLAAQSTKLIPYRGVCIYSVGDNYPQFNNRIAVRPFGQITRSIRVPGQVILPQGAIGRLYDVKIEDPGNLPESTGTGVIEFPSRKSVNPTPVSSTGPSVAPRTYRVVNTAPEYANSTFASNRIVVGPDDQRKGVDGQLIVTPGLIRFVSQSSAFTVDDLGSKIIVLRAENAQNAGAYLVNIIVNSTTVTLTRERRLDNTLSPVSEDSLPWIFDSSQRYDGRRLYATSNAASELLNIQQYLSDPELRPICSNNVARYPNIVYVGVGIANPAFPDTSTTTPLRYQLKSSSSTPLDVSAARVFVADFINNFNRQGQELNTFDVAAALAARFPDQIDNVLPLTFNYILVAPNGDLVYFNSNDRLSISNAYLVRSADAALLDNAQKQGVTNRVVKLIATPDLIRMQRV